jgi:type IV pilus assembly protein PilF
MKRLCILFNLLLFAAAGCATVNRDPTDNYSTYQLQQMGERFLAARDLGQALRFLSLAEKRHPNDPVIQYYLGLAYYERGLKYDAFTHLNKALTLKPDYPEAENALGRYYAEQAQLDKAQQSFEKAVASPFYATPELALYNLGMIYEKKGDSDTALKHYQEAVRLQPNYGLAYYRMGLLLEQLRRADEARDAYGKAIDLAPDLVEAQYRYGVMSYTAGELENAFYSLNRVVKLAPHSTMAEDARRYLGRAQTIIPLGPSRISRAQPADRGLEMDIVTDRDLVSEQKVAGLPSDQSKPTPVPANSQERKQVDSDRVVPEIPGKGLQELRIPAASLDPGEQARAEVPSDQLNPLPLGEISQEEKSTDFGKAIPEAPGEDQQEPQIMVKSRRYIVQLGSFLLRENAEVLRERLTFKGYDAVVKPFNHQILGQLYVVQLKPINDADKARQLLMDVEREAHVKAIMYEVPVK